MSAIVSPSISFNIVKLSISMFTTSISATSSPRTLLATSVSPSPPPTISPWLKCHHLCHDSCRGSMSARSHLCRDSYYCQFPCRYQLSSPMSLVAKQHHQRIDEPSSSLSLIMSPTVSPTSVTSCFANHINNKRHIHHVRTHVYHSCRQHPFRKQLVTK